MSNYELKKTIDCNQGAVRAVRYNVDGSYCLTCGSDKKIKLWNPHRGLLLKTYGGHADEVTDAAGSCDSCHIVSSSLDKSIIYWDVTTGRPLRRLRGHLGGVKCVRFNENSAIVISGARDNRVMCWDVRTRNPDPIQTMKDATDCITSIIVNDHEIISSSLDGGIRHYDIRSAKLICDKLNQTVTFAVQTKDQQCVLAACMDGALRLIDNDNGSILTEYKGHKAEDFHIECGILSNDSEIISGSTEGSAAIWKLIDEKDFKRLPIGEGTIHSIATHPTGLEVIFAKRREVFLFGPKE